MSKLVALGALVVDGLAVLGHTLLGSSTEPTGPVNLLSFSTVLAIMASFTALITFY